MSTEQTEKKRIIVIGKRKTSRKPPPWLKCVMKNQGVPCGEMMELIDEGSGKYWLYNCKAHGGISVLKGSRWK